jgi:hypothetical protein
MKAIKKPIPVEVFPLTQDTTTFPTWLSDAVRMGIVLLGSSVRIRTLEGSMYAEYGDYIVLGVKGELYSIKKGIFEETYDIVKD